MTTELASALMLRFAERTGLIDARVPAKRYLWTDAFAVCNFIELGRIDLASALVDRVHHILGRHRADDRRGGWISGLDREAGELHPTIGGLRIGKPLPERSPDQRGVIDERLEWDRDGQYFHYLTKWMHALDQLARVTERPVFNTWARELADTAYARFVYGSPPRMYWKMTVDLSRPLVASMGQHDPLDGFITCLELSATAAALGPFGTELDEAAATFASMIDPGSLATTDPLGIGGLLVDAYRLAQLPTRHRRLFEAVLAAASLGLDRYFTEADLGARASQRLAFRELGLAIGLAAAARLTEPRLERYIPLRGELEAFWLQPEHRETATWLDHADINDVMLATSLAPDGFLDLRGMRAGSELAHPLL